MTVGTEISQSAARRQVIGVGNRMIKTNLPLDADRLWADVMALAEITDPARPYTRRSLTSLFLEGRGWASTYHRCHRLPR